MKHLERRCIGKQNKGVIMTELYFRSDLDLKFPVKEVYNLNGKKVGKKTCYKCNGTGYIPHLANVDEGRCWNCNKRGYEIFRVYSKSEMQSVIKSKNKKDLEKRNAWALTREIIAIQKMKHNHKAYLKNVAYKTQKIKAKYQSEYVGQVGEKLEKSLTLDWCIRKEGNYGYYFIKQLHDEDGNIYSHMGSSITDKDYNLIPKGTTFTLKFTVKEHSEYNGIKQTKIKNPKLGKE